MYIYIMYVYICVAVSVCVHVCMHVCVRPYGWMDGWTVKITPSHVLPDFANDPSAQDSLC